MDWYPLFNSLRIAAISTVIVFFLGIACAHWLSRLPGLVKALKGSPGGAVHQGEGHHYRGEDGGLPGHHQTDAKGPLDPASQGTLGAQQQEEQPAHHRGGQHQGKRKDYV